jgi:hypothetical protein
MAKDKKWIQGADIDEGALTEKAKRAGFPSWQSFCSQPDDKLSPESKRQCNLAKTLTKMAKSRKNK